MRCHSIARLHPMKTQNRAEPSINPSAIPEATGLKSPPLPLRKRSWQIKPTNLLTTPLRLRATLHSTLEPSFGPSPTTTRTRTFGFVCPFTDRAVADYGFRLAVMWDTDDVAAGSDLTPSGSSGPPRVGRAGTQEAPQPGQARPPCHGPRASGQADVLSFRPSFQPQCFHAALTKSSETKTAALRLVWI